MMGSMEIVPISDLLRQLVLALGAALLVGNLAVIVRERRRRPGDERPKPNWTVVGVNVLLGTVLTVWGVASIIAAR